MDEVDLRTEISRAETDMRPTVKPENSPANTTYGTRTLNAFTTRDSDTHQGKAETHVNPKRR